MSRSTPTILSCFTYTLSISNEGSVYSTGNNSSEYGNDSEALFLPKMIPCMKNIQSIALGDEKSVCLDTDGNVYTLGSNFAGELGIGADPTKS